MLLSVACATSGPKEPPAPFKKEKISQNDEPHLPDAVLAPRCGATLSGAYKLCITREGSISSVEVVQGIPDGDASIVPALKQWRYKPLPIPLCFIQNLEFRIDCQKLRPADELRTRQSGDEPAAASIAEQPPLRHCFYTEKPVPPPCAGVAYGARQPKAELHQVCNACLNDAHCTEHPGGRCIDTYFGPCHGNGEKACVYPGEGCHPESATACPLCLNREGRAVCSEPLTMPPAAPQPIHPDPLH